MSFLTVKNIFSLPQQGSFILKDISFDQNKFQKIAIAGETGSGKSTLLKIIAGLIPPASGTVYFEDAKVKGPDWQLIPGQKGIAYLSKHFELRHNYRMEELLDYANELPQADAENIYSICRITELMTRYHDELSGGEKQRIALARLLISSPRLLILDEPFSNLDLIHRNILKKVITDLSEKLAITIIMASHDPADSLPWADEIILLQNGEIIQKDTPNIIYNFPLNEYTAGLFGDYNIIDASNKELVLGLKLTVKMGDQYFIRPNQIAISEAGIKAKIINCNFHGEYYKVLIAVAGVKLLLNSQRKYEVDDVICINH